MKTTKWQKSINDDQMMGINYWLCKAVMRHKDRLGCFYNDEYVKRIVIHSYREEGTALVINAEILYDCIFGERVVIGQIVC